MTTDAIFAHKLLDPSCVCAIAYLHSQTLEILTDYPELNWNQSANFRLAFYDNTFFLTAVEHKVGLLSHHYASLMLKDPLAHLQKAMISASLELPSSLSKLDDTEKQRVSAWGNAIISRAMKEQHIQVPILEIHALWLFASFTEFEVKRGLPQFGDYSAIQEARPALEKILSNPATPVNFINQYGLHPIKPIRQFVSELPHCPEETRVAIALLD